MNTTIERNPGLRYRINKIQDTREISVSDAGSGLDPDSIRSVDPYPDPDPEGKMTYNQKYKFFRNIIFKSVGCSLWMASSVAWTSFMQAQG